MEKLFSKFINDYQRSFHPLKEEMLYALYPAGKLFRPKLFNAICENIGVLNKESINSFALFLEVHHAYSLVHDDLPCMDNSDFRRGKESVHKKFGEWKAVLVGDALLSLSYKLLSTCQLEQQFQLEKLVHWSLGAKGLIAGQVLDLSAKDPSYKEIERIHELKTGRLILLSTLAPYYFLNSKNSILFKKLWNLGTQLGRYFQLKDDYDDFLKTPDEDLNIFRIDEKRALEDLKKCEESLALLLSGFPEVQTLIKVLN